jgi:hypothetical protein
MITAIEIENFKGIDKRVRVELKPLTLLFGPNSAGKSTIMQALQYAYELLEHHNPDADRTTLGGQHADLGGFCNLVYGHDRQRKVRLRLELDMDGSDLCRLFPVRPYPLPLRKLGISRRPDLSRRGEEVRSAWVELVVAWDEQLAVPSVSEYHVGLDGQHVGTIDMALNFETSTPRAHIDSLNLHHPLFRWPTHLMALQESSYCIAHWVRLGIDWEGLLGFYYENELVRKISQDEIDQPVHEGEADYVYEVTPLAEFDLGSLRRGAGLRAWGDEGMVNQADMIVGLTHTDRRLAVHSIRIPSRQVSDKRKADERFEREIEHYQDERNASVALKHKNSVVPDWNEWLEVAYDEEGGHPRDRYAEMRRLFLSDLLSRFLVGPGQLLREELRRLRHVGPLRDTPPRLYDTPHSKEPSRWSKGLAAWDTLRECSDDLLQELNAWLADKERLDTGYQIDRRRFHRIEADGPLMCRLRSGEAVDPQEIEKLPLSTEIDLVGRNGIRLAPQDVGEGIRQVLPILVAALEPTHASQDSMRGIVTLEQPELHLHPRQQAALGDVLLEAVLGKPGNWILVETHSEHLILRILRRIREASKAAGKPFITPEHVGVWYVGREDGSSVPTEIGIDDRGEFLCPWPDSFFEQDFQERFA